MFKKKIFFHADDFGRTTAISKNILRCIEFGNINSVSVIINKNDNLHKKLKKLKRIKKKLHLNLTDSTELSDSKNRKLFNKINFFSLFFLNESEKTKIKSEIVFQIENYIKLYKPKNLKIDGHQHVHMIPWIFKFLLKIKKKYKIDEIRISNESFQIPELIDFINVKYYRNIIAMMLLKFLSYLINKKRTNSPEFSGIIYSGIQNKKTIIKTIRFLKNKALKDFEILVHPGFTNSKEKKKFKKEFYAYYNSTNRMIEYNLCFSKKIKKELKF